MHELDGSHNCGPSARTTMYQPITHIYAIDIDIDIGNFIHTGSNVRQLIDINVCELLMGDEYGISNKSQYMMLLIRLTHSAYYLFN